MFIYLFYSDKKLKEEAFTAFKTIKKYAEQTNKLDDESLKDSLNKNKTKFIGEFSIFNNRIKGKESK